jgi:hypothetical protein
MALITVKEAAAASAVGTNLMAGHRLQIAPRYRRVRRMGVVGSTNPGDGSVDLFYGDTFIGTFFNTSGGANLIPLDAKDMIKVPSNLAMLPFEPLNLLISDAGVSNIMVVTMEVEEF